jgi:predicted phosphoribosyltransferase
VTPDVYRNRRHAGSELAGHLDSLRGRDDVVVLALPRGGVPVAYEVARALPAPLDVFLVRKLGVPRRRELAMGAIASGGVRVVNDDVVSWYGITPAELDAVARDEQAELARQEQRYRAGRPAPLLSARVVVLVDDGLATGSTMKAAVQAVRGANPSRVIVAVPVGARETCRELAAIADQIVCPLAPDRFAAVGEWYLDFSPTSDEEVRELLGSATI